MWEHNAAGKSCIPAGEYPLAKRTSAIVYRSSGNEFHQGWEVQDVPSRSLIILHPGNWASDSNGCILTGRAHVIMGNKLAVSASRAAFKDLMARLSRREDWRLAVRWVTPQ